MHRIDKKIEVSYLLWKIFVYMCRMNREKKNSQYTEIDHYNLQ